MARILMVASEATPFAKTGGLADVLGALPAALRERGEEVAVVLPRYGRIGLDHARRVWDDLELWLGPNRVRAAVYEIRHRGVPYYFLDCPGLFDRAGLYGEHNTDYGDNSFRFAALCRPSTVCATSSPYTISATREISGTEISWARSACRQTCTALIYWR
jgi:starch synthase